MKSAFVLSIFGLCSASPLRQDELEVGEARVLTLGEQGDTLEGHGRDAGPSSTTTP